jgi:hypothetical protein
MPRTVHRKNKNQDGPLFLAHHLIATIPAGKDRDERGTNRRALACAVGR